ncbi:nitrilase-related carbon-nitrogen hydrolase [Roseobacter ponti]|uniref:Hydrolase n=1 Tax=Roseobacter ponti TaxID=1891787 RepID=A0A858SUY3_9RHOB|nr:nitrilase-related carbon-nitrogen hydrolase [Roseobacter ponti]QJF51817.1 hydrolase [Roseobacter ponti]
MITALYQMPAGIAPDARADAIETALREAAAAGAGLLVAPELALSGYGRGPVLRDLAQQSGGPWYRRLHKVVQETGTALVAGFPERSGHTCYISAMVLCPDDGATPAAPQVYRKAMLYGGYEKGIFASDGPSTVLFAWQGLKIGVLICFDIEFPENIRRLALAGADMVVVPTALPAGASGAFTATRMIPVRAFENGIFVVYANHCGTDERFTFQGMSSVTAPDGTVLASASAENADLLFADIDPAAYDHVREVNPYLKDISETSQ